MIRIIFWTIIIVLFLSFFGISIQGLLENPTTEKNFAFVLGLLSDAWDTLWGIISGFVTGFIDFITGLNPF